MGHGKVHNVKLDGSVVLSFKCKVQREFVFISSIVNEKNPLLERNALNISRSKWSSGQSNFCSKGMWDTEQT